MNERIPQTEGGPASRLERWLVRGLQSGSFEALPHYHALRGGGQRPEQYAQRLLAALNNAELSGWDRERLRDDGRAFRSWAEMCPAPVAVS